MQPLQPVDGGRAGVDGREGRAHRSRRRIDAEGREERRHDVRRLHEPGLPRRGAAEVARPGPAAGRRAPRAGELQPGLPAGVGERRDDHGRVGRQRREHGADPGVGGRDLRGRAAGYPARAPHRRRRPAGPGTSRGPAAPGWPAPHRRRPGCGRWCRCPRPRRPGPLARRAGPSRWRPRARSRRRGRRRPPAPRRRRASTPAGRAGRRPGRRLRDGCRRASGPPGRSSPGCRSSRAPGTRLPRGRAGLVRRAGPGRDPEPAVDGAGAGAHAAGRLDADRTLREQAVQGGGGGSGVGPADAAGAHEDDRARDAVRGRGGGVRGGGGGRGRGDGGARDEGERPGRQPAPAPPCTGTARRRHTARLRGDPERGLGAAHGPFRGVRAADAGRMARCPP